jgi:hypothetical protein
MNPGKQDHPFGNTMSLPVIVFLCATLFARPLAAQSLGSSPFPSPSLIATFTQTTVNLAPTIPSGTIFPVRLNATLSSAKCKPGQEITARIMQDVPLPKGAKIPEGSKVIGHIVDVAPATASSPARISLRFDKLLSSHQTVAITANLRAIAGFMQINEAQTPPVGPSESDVYRWLTTVQVGGDAVYGEGGVVTAAENANLVVGKAVNGGVLSQVRAKAGTKCRGAIDGNDAPQAFWVFSSDACGTYGFQHIYIAHAGRTDPRGVIVFISDTGNVKIPGGAGILLRINAGDYN